MTRAAGAVSVLSVAALLGTAGCGVVLGLNDYGDRVDGASASGGDDGGAEVGEGSAGGGDAPADTPYDAAAIDSGVDTGADTGTDTGPATYDAGGDAPSLGDAAPAGWTPVAFSTTPQTSCPAGSTSSAQSVVFGNPTTVPAAACTCDCSMTSTPSCVTGTITGSYDSTGTQTCGTPSPSLANANPGGCNTDNPHTSLANLDILWNPPAPSGGACSASTTAHGDRVSFAGQGTICSTPGDAGALSGAFRACIASPGNLACPAGPYTVAYHAGAGAMVSCTGACSCSSSATCGNGVVTYYKNANCSGTGGGGSFPMPANGQCTQLSGGSSTYASYKYTASLLAAACTGNGSPVATFTGLASEQTVCCGP